HCIHTRRSQRPHEHRRHARLAHARIRAGDEEAHGTIEEAVASAEAATSSCHQFIGSIAHSVRTNVKAILSRICSRRVKIPTKEHRSTNCVRGSTCNFHTPPLLTPLNLGAC